MLSVRRMPAVAAAVGGMVILGACSASVHVGSDSVPSARLAQQVDAALAAKVGRSVDVSCPDDLPAKAGSVVHCKMTDHGHRYQITVTSEGLNRKTGKVHFGAHVTEVK